MTCIYCLGYLHPQLLAYMHWQTIYTMIYAQWLIWFSLFFTGCLYISFNQIMKKAMSYSRVKNRSAVKRLKIGMYLMKMADKDMPCAGIENAFQKACLTDNSILKQVNTRNQTWNLSNMRRSLRELRITIILMIFFGWLLKNQ